jgi:hypothetical protein
MKYIKYNLKWTGPVGDQPYYKVAESGAELEGGQLVDGLDYYGYMHGTDEQCLKGIENSKSEFNMIEITDVEYTELYKKLVPIGSKVNDPRFELVGEDDIVEDFVKDKDGKIKLKTKKVKKQ